MRKIVHGSSIVKTKPKGIVSIIMAPSLLPHKWDVYKMWLRKKKKLSIAIIAHGKPISHACKAS